MEQLTMKFIQLDDWKHPVYKCIENEKIYKDGNSGKGTPVLYTCGNQIDGELGFSLKIKKEIKFIDQYQENPHRFNYMMLDRLRSDCDYFLGNGHRNLNRLWNDNIDAHITEMKRLYNNFPEDGKPQWLPYDKILEYETEMKEGNNE